MLTLEGRSSPRLRRSTPEACIDDAGRWGKRASTLLAAFFCLSWRCFSLFFFCCIGNDHKQGGRKTVQESCQVEQRWRPGQDMRM